MMTWYSEYRQEWIREMLDIYGFINREHLVKKFGISVPQASKDLTTFLIRNKNIVTYDLSRKAYVRK